MMTRNAPRPWSLSRFRIGFFRRGNSIGKDSKDDITSCLKVVRHHFVRPFWLPNRSSVGNEFSEDWFDVYYRRPVHRVKTLDFECQPFDRDQATNSGCDPVGSGLCPLSEDANFGPVRVSSGVSAPLNDQTLIDTMQMKKHFDMGKLRESFQ